MKCRHCDVEMKSGMALLQTITSGEKDFPGDEYAVTFSAGGPGQMVKCEKCPKCGYSVHRTEKDDDGK